MLKTLMNTTLAAGFAALATVASAEKYPTPVPLQDGAQAAIDAITPKNDTFRIAYMPPATEFNYYIA
ncbi:MAG: sugar ABC transporter substrate-binding protein, partial [Arenibacterium sp.]